MLCTPRKHRKRGEHDERKQFRVTEKILLLGTGESGKTTIIKQMKILHINGFSEQERKEKIPHILNNIHESIFDILDNMDKIDPPIEIESIENRTASEYIKNLDFVEVPTGHYSHEYFDRVKSLWADVDVQKAFERSNEYQLIDSASHFLDRIDEIRKADYIPTTQDILYCRIKTTTISTIEFDVPVPRSYGGGVAHFLMYDVGGQRGQRKKWIQAFDGIEAILFLIAASDFDLTLREDPTKNRLEEALTVFKDIYCSRFVRDAGLIVFLNKQDLLRKKVENGKKIEHYFPDYTNYRNVQKDCTSEYEVVRNFIHQKILDISNTILTVEYVGFIPGKSIHQKLPARSVHIHHTIATDTENIKRVFNSVHEIILQKNITNVLY